MKFYFYIFCCLIFQNSSLAQYYLRGEVTNGQGEGLANVTITVHSTKTHFKTGYSGEFKVPISFLNDTVSFSLDGYEPFTEPAKATEFLKVELEPIHVEEIEKINYLSSVIKTTVGDKTKWTLSGEDYSSIIENPFVDTKEVRSTSFSANINRASYSNIRRFLNMNERVPPDAVRIEEMLNYFNFKYTEPPGEQVFQSSSYLTTCPWNKKNQLLFVNICARKTDLKNLPPCNLVFLIDVSGSMEAQNKLPLLQSGFRSLVKNLRSIDTISIVTYGDQIKVALEKSSGDEKEKIINAIEALTASGSTPGEAGLKLAYQVAQLQFIKGGNNRIILATDGDFNVGLTSEKELEDLVEQKSETGIYLTCLGVGMGNYKDAKLSLLAQKGKGNFAYIDNEDEAEKVLVTEFTQTIYAVADNVIITTTFNPSVAESFRLIGFDNKRTALTDTASRLKGGEIGSGHSLMVLFEVVPAAQSLPARDFIADIHISYNLPLTNVSQAVNHRCAYNILPYEELDSSLKKTSCIALFGMRLKESDFIPTVKWAFIKKLANECFNKKRFMDNELLRLLDKAKKIYKERKTKNLQ